MLGSSRCTIVQLCTHIQTPGQSSGADSPWTEGRGAREWSLTSTGLATGSLFNASRSEVWGPRARAWVDGAHPLTPGPGGDSLSPAHPAPTPSCSFLGEKLSVPTLRDGLASKPRAQEQMNLCCRNSCDVKFYCECLW